jgi:hypothetical protein
LSSLGFSKLEFRPRPSTLFNKAGIWVKAASRENGPWRPIILLRRQLRLLRIIFPHKVNPIDRDKMNRN